MKRTYLRTLMVTNRIALPVEPPSRILICPWGDVASKSGGFVVDSDSVAAIMAAFTAHGVDLPIDIEHQTVGTEDYQSPDGAAPAVGWIKSLEPVPDEGLYANVEWTERGAEWIASKAYRYLSPVVFVRKVDRRAIELHSAALTNKPAIVGMSPVAHKETFVMLNDEKFERARWFLNLPETAESETIMNELEKFLAQLRELLGVAADADQAATVAALKAKLTPATGVSVAICKAAGLAENAGEAAVVAAINAAKTRPAGAPDLSGYVPKAEFEVVANSLRSASEKLAALEARSVEREAAERIAAAKAAGKLTDAMLVPNSAGKNHFITLARDEAAWNEWLERTPVIAAANGRAVTNSGGATSASGGSGERVAIINKARAEFDSEPALAAITNRAAFAADALRHAGHTAPLTDDEKKLVA